MPKTMTINEEGTELFCALQDTIIDKDTSSGQAVCALAELVVWAMLAVADCDADAAVSQFEHLIPAIKKGIRENADDMRLHCSEPAGQA
jgi:hypothetical protein